MQQERSSKIDAARRRDQRLLNRSLRREDADRMNTYSLPRNMNKVVHEATCRRLLESVGTENCRRIQMDLKAKMEAMAAVSKAHVRFCQSTKSLVSAGENSALMREVEVTHNHATHPSLEATWRGP